MATRYSVTYQILPAGVGPDDYESKDLETRTTSVSASDPEEAGHIAGERRHYFPSHAELQAALRPHLAPGDHPIIRDIKLADAS
ncbi:hypothetical protein ACGFZH_20840 [Streptomyces zaomyceticus]|uniref:hypothetical protein n=1 Tax=Streptomyces zaomyceticus TaxID=68286 RepID=UPI003712890B